MREQDRDVLLRDNSSLQTHVFALPTSFLRYIEAVEPLWAPFGSLAWPRRSSFREGKGAGAALRRETVPGRNCGCMTDENTARAERTAADVVECRGTPEKDTEEAECTGEESLDKKPGPTGAEGRAGTTWSSVMTFVRDANSKRTGAKGCSGTTWSPVVTSTREAKLGILVGSKVIVDPPKDVTTGKKALRGLRVSERCIGGRGTVGGIGTVVD